MMNGSAPDSASMPVAPGLALADGGLVVAKSGTSRPTHFFCASSHHTHFLRSLHGRPFKSAEARLYMIRRLAGHAYPQPSCAPGVPGGSDLRLAERLWLFAGNTPQQIDEAHVDEAASYR